MIRYKSNILHVFELISNINIKNSFNQMLMSNLMAKKFNKKASNPKNKPDKVLQTIDPKPGQNIVDIGSGGGYFTLRFAKIVGDKGKIYAVDTNPVLLDYVKNSAKKEGLDNIETILTKEDRVDLPEKSIDIIFMRNVTHHLFDRVEYFKQLKKFLTARGRVVILEYKKGKSFTFRGLFGHYLPKEVVMREMQESGYRLEKEFDFLPEQHFTIYSSEG